MKFLSAAVATLMVIGTVSEASAVVCARGVYRAGCAGPRGAVTTTRPVARPVVAPVRCYYRAGVRVCR
jgi:hypothetical protein